MSEELLPPVLARPKLPGEAPKLINDNVDAALTRYHGNRRLAAKDLNIDTQRLANIIAYNPHLAAKWSTSGVNTMNLSDIESLTMVRLEGYHDERENLLNQVAKLEERIAKAEKANELWSEEMNAEDALYYKKYHFRCNIKGEPSEEIMVREAYGNLVENLRLLDESIAGIIHVKAKVKSLDRESVNTQRKPGRLRSASKASMINARNSVHIHPTPGSKTLIVQSDGASD